MPNLLHKLKLQKGLKEFQELVSNQRKKLAKKYHPDKFNKDNGERMKSINNVVDFIMGLQVQPIRRPVNIISRSVFSYQNASSTTSTDFFYYNI